MNTLAISRRRLIIAGAASAAALGAAPGRLLAQSYPDRAITFICPWPAGGTADQSMRTLCTVASRVLGQPIALENRAGASGMIGAKALASARPDGYTIGQIPISVTRFAQLGRLQGDPRTDFTYLARTSGQTFGIVVRPDSPFKTLQELVAHAKAHPGQLSYAHAGIGGATHVGMEEFASAAGIAFNDVPFKGGAEALQSVIGGHVDVLMDSTSWAPHVEAGKLRLLVTMGAQRTTRFKDVPTLRELGYDVVVDAPNGIGAPKGLEPAVEERLRQAFRKAVESPEFKAVADQLDAPVLYLDGPAYKAYVEQTYDKDAALIKKLKLQELMRG